MGSTPTSSTEKRKKRKKRFDKLETNGMIEVDEWGVKKQSLDDLDKKLSPTL